MASKLKFKKNIIFQHGDNYYYLFKILNFGKEDTDELKFNFSNPSGGTGIIYIEDELNLDDDSIITSYGEMTYHQEGEIHHKFPKYPIKERQYINPLGKGTKKQPLQEITEWEPLFELSIYDYELNRIKTDIKTEDSYIVNDYTVTNAGYPFRIVTALVKGEYKPFSFISENRYMRNFILKNVCTNIHLWMKFTPLEQNGYNITMKNGKKVFSINNTITILDR